MHYASFRVLSLHVTSARGTFPYARIPVAYRPFLYTLVIPAIYWHDDNIAPTENTLLLPQKNTKRNLIISMFFQSSKGLQCWKHRIFWIETLTLSTEPRGRGRGGGVGGWGTSRVVKVGCYHDKGDIQTFWGGWVHCQFVCPVCTLRCLWWRNIAPLRWQKGRGWRHTH